MSNIYFIADTHFYHKNIIKYENRPFKTVEEMNEVLINNWNNTVKEDDIIWHLGDVALCGAAKIKELVPKLNGRKFLIMGNHDRRNTVTFWKKCGFKEVYKEPVKVKDFILSHEPISEPGKINICGHVHSKTEHLNPIWHHCVSVEMTNYKPVILDCVNSYYYFMNFHEQGGYFMNKFLSQKARKVWENVLTDNEYDILPEDYKHKVTKDGTFLPKDFCIVGFLNEFQRYIDKGIYHKGIVSDGKPNLPIPDNVFDWLMEFGLFLEYVLAIHDGRKK